MNQRIHVRQDYGFLTSVANELLVSMSTHVHSKAMYCLRSVEQQIGILFKMSYLPRYLGHCVQTLCLQEGQWSVSEWAKRV